MTTDPEEPENDPNLPPDESDVEAFAKAHTIGPWVALAIVGIVAFAASIKACM